MTYNPKLTGERMNEVNEASPASETSDVERVVIRLRKEADKHQTVFGDDRRRKALFYEAATEIDRLQDIERRFYALLYCVECKWEGETREQTAARYIKEREHSYREACAAQYEPSFHGAATDAV